MSGLCVFFAASFATSLFLAHHILSTIQAKNAAESLWLPSGEPKTGDALAAVLTARQWVKIRQALDAREDLQERVQLDVGCTLYEANVARLRGAGFRVSNKVVWLPAPDGKDDA